MRRLLQCFVASAFDRPDVDAIYDKAIRPVLRKLGITPYRVDRGDRNDDIDDRIYKFIDACDLCIADLTYARPSVYYEAGYAFGNGKEIIYIAKSDHFRARDDDPAGNLRIHFDLQMKDIISWTEPNNAFRSRLERRVRHVTKPLQAKRDQEEKDDAKTQEFLRLSQNAKLYAIATVSRAVLKRLTFKNPISTFDVNQIDTMFEVERWRKTTLQTVEIFVIPSATKKQLRLYSRGRSFKDITLKDKAKHFERLTVFATLSPMRRSTLTDAFPHCVPISDKLLDGPPNKYFPNSRRTIAVIDGVRSPEEYEQRFKAVCDTLGFGNLRRRKK